MPAPASTPDGAPHLDILIIEDECLIAEYLKDILADSRFDVVGIADAVPDALALAERTRPQISLVDLILRDRLEGFVAAQVLREGFGTTVLFVSGLPDAEAQARAVLAGAIPILLKPFLPRHLLHMMSTAAKGLAH